MAEAVIFDMDGVLVNSEPYHFEAEEQILAKIGITLTDKEVQSFVGLAMDSMWMRLKESYSLEKSVEELLKEDTEFRVNFFREVGKIKPIDGVRALITDIKSSGLKTAVASSSHPDLIRVILEASDLAEFFPFYLSGFQVKKGKPEPDIFIETARLLGVECSRCVVIEDSLNGVKAAKKAGMKCIGYSNPFSGDQDLSAADIIISNFSEINTSYLKDL